MHLQLPSYVGWAVYRYLVVSQNSPSTPQMRARMSSKVCQLNSEQCMVDAPQCKTILRASRRVTLLGDGHRTPYNGISCFFFRFLSHPLDVPA